jgi:hypothetical protein
LTNSAGRLIEPQAVRAKLVKALNSSGNLACFPSKKLPFYYTVLLAIAPWTGLHSDFKPQQVPVTPSVVESQVGLSTGLLTLPAGRLSLPTTKRSFVLPSIRVEV